MLLLPPLLLLLLMMLIIIELIKPLHLKTTIQIFFKGAPHPFLIFHLVTRKNISPIINQFNSVSL
jgi:hypothetical protein